MLLRGAGRGAEFHRKLDVQTVEQGSGPGSGPGSGRGSRMRILLDLPGVLLLSCGCGLLDVLCGE